MTHLYQIIVEEIGKGTAEHPVTSQTCRKCGWHQSYWKF